MYTVAVLWTVFGVVLNAQKLEGLSNDRPVRINLTTTNGTSSFPPLPQNCSVGENWTSCASSTCWERKCGVTPNTICSRDCRAGCRCAAGFARLGNVCINETNCPKNVSLSNRSLVLGASASSSASSLSTNFNQTARECGKGEIWTQCSSSSCFEHRCDTKPSLLCTRDCRMGCKCANGFARLGKDCVNETQCVTLRAGKLGKGLRNQSTVANISVAPTTSPTFASQVMFVGSFLQTCDGGAANSQCLVTKSSKDAQFSATLRSINGFTFEPGFDYKLRVRPQQTQAGKTRYVLVSIVTKTATGVKSSAPTPLSSYSGCAEVMCMVFCDNGYKRDAQGCQICSCNPAPVITCPDTTCDNLCPSGYQRNAAGCATCNCAPIQASLIPPPAYNCDSRAGWSLAKIAACCVPLPPEGSIANNLCQTGFLNGFASL